MDLSPFSVYTMISVYVLWFLDAFLHQVSTGIGRLRDTVAKVCDIIRNRVETTLEQIHDFLLFDSDLAFSRAWVSRVEI